MTVALARVTQALLAEREAAGHWSGKLSTSALATATAIIALANVDPRAHAGLLNQGLGWLAQHANADGGWGDTIRSQSNLSTTALVWAAFGAAGADTLHPAVVAGAEDWIRQRAGSLENLVPAIESAYGQDRTFSVPITMALALSGRLGPGGWRQVRPLPFELGALPAGLYGALRLPVVSYALPALIAIGQVIHHFSPPPNPVTRAVRSLARARTLGKLTHLQPANGGFLEAIPLTSFVVMSLAGMGLPEHPVTQRGTAFLVRAAQPDGAWRIDTNLASWVTTLSLKALAHQPAVFRSVATPALRDWLLAQQHHGRHPYTQAAPGGWAWTDLPGGVPDADDTAGALLALHHLQAHCPDPRIPEAARSGVTWLLDLQNRDGGIPTFCRGWGTLPFDHSAPELTAHALRAWNAWQPQLPSPIQARLHRASTRAHQYLARSQRPDGAWLPLWFGNEAAPSHGNPVYGTGHVLLALRQPKQHLPAAPGSLAAAGRRFLVGAQNADGGWGGDRGISSTVEETAIAVEALLPQANPADPVARGVRWLVQALENSPAPAASPIGLYFARLWYFERLYPLVFAASALGAARASSLTPG